MPIPLQIDLAFSAVLVVATYKIASLLVGLGFAYMGYRLFLAGIAEPAGDLEAATGDRSVKLVRAAPGTFFALFGAAVITVTIYKGFDVELPGAARSLLSSLPENPPMAGSNAGG